jgi:hypothetical protein
MIRYSPDGKTLIGVDEKGKEFTSNMMSGATFSVMLATLDLQKNAALANDAAVADYNQKLTNAQTNINNGNTQGVVIPTKPMCQFVSDTGAVDNRVFDPPLASIVYPHDVPPRIITTDVGLTTYDMVLRIYQHTFPNG